MLTRPRTGIRCSTLGPSAWTDGSRTASRRWIGCRGSAGPRTSLGTVTAAAAAETGLPVGVPVAVGTVDVQAEALSVGVAEPGDLMLMYGSTTFLLLVLTSARCRPTRSG